MLLCTDHDLKETKNKSTIKHFVVHSIRIYLNCSTMISTSELMQKLQDCSSLEEVSNLREELFDILEPEQHVLLFARLTHFLGQEEEPPADTPADTPADPEFEDGKCNYKL